MRVILRKTIRPERQYNGLAFEMTKEHGESPRRRGPDATGSASEPVSGGLLDLLKRAAEAALVFGALLYVTGWSYLDGYYATFGLKVGQLGVSNQEAALSSFQFIFHSPTSTISFCVGIIAAGLGLSYLYGRVGQRRELAVVALLLLLLCVSGWLSHRASVLGRNMAWKDMVTATSSLPRVEVEVDRTKLSDNLVHYRDLESKGYRLLLQTENRVWLFRSTDHVKGILSVVTLPKESLRVMTIERATPEGGK